jgi:succinoglycan biosynthesis protein ExoM
MIPKRAGPMPGPLDSVIAACRDAGESVDFEVDVCVCTFRRPSLKETLLSIAAQKLPQGVTMRVIVADNDETPSGKALVEQIGREAGLRIHYIHAPARNISTARNACLDAACAPVMAFIDDDEIASVSWLSNLLESQRRSGVDITFGPVKAIYPRGPGWLAQADLHSIEPVRRADGKLTTGYTSNVLLNRQTLGERLRTCRFDRELGRSGGEDTLFFHALHLAGAQMNFCAEAVVTESVPDHRARLGWLLSRSFRSGQSHGRMLLQDHGGRIGLIAVASAKLAYCLGCACVQVVVPSGQRRAARRRCREDRGHS